MNFGNYQTRRNDKGHLIVENVPIFVECSRGDSNFDVDWITQAVMKAKQAEAEGYLPPLHIRHHEAGTPVEPAGYFRIRGAGPITFKGNTRTAIFADLVITRPWVEDDVVAARLPYRSVEIFDVDDPAINSLALLDHEPPYLELPMLMVDEPAPVAGDDGALAVPTSGTLVRVADATFKSPYTPDRARDDGMVVACFRRGHSVHLFLEDPETTMSIKKTKTGDAPKSKTKIDGKTPALFAYGDGEKMADDESDGEKMADDEGDGEDMAEGEGGMDVGAICKAIRDGSISVADMEEIKAAILEQVSATTEEAEPEDAPAPAPVPGAAMKNDSSKGDHFARLAGENAALKARLDARDQADELRDNVTEAMQRLEGRPLGADLKNRLELFHKEHGAKAFKSYVDSMVQTFGAMSTTAATRGAAFAAQSAPAHTEALAYADQGEDAVAKAQHFAAEHDQLAGSGLRHSKAAYIASNMMRAGFKAPAKKG